MKKRILGCAAVLALMGGGSGPVVKAADPVRPCCFTNTRYSGVCSVQPGEGESCASILEYLNNPNSQGKSYCDNTNIRGGWQQKKCEAPSD